MKKLKGSRLLRLLLADLILIAALAVSVGAWYAKNARVDSSSIGVYTEEGDGVYYLNYTVFKEIWDEDDEDYVWTAFPEPTEANPLTLNDYDTVFTEVESNEHTAVYVCIPICGRYVADGETFPVTLTYRPLYVSGNSGKVGEYFSNIIEMKLALLDLDPESAADVGSFISRVDAAMTGDPFTVAHYSQEDGWSKDSSWATTVTASGESDTAYIYLKMDYNEDLSVAFRDTQINFFSYNGRDNARPFSADITVTFGIAG